MKRALSMLLVLIMIFSLGCMSIPAAAIKEDVYLAGDMNGDDLVNVMDSLVLFRYLNGQTENLNEGANGDLNNDGHVDIADALKLFRYVNKQIDSVTTEGEYSIADVEIEDGRINIVLSTINSCLLKVRFINEDDTEAVADDVTEILNSNLNMEMVSYDLPDGLPAYYKMVAYLCDENGNHLCDSFSSIHETADYQTFMEKTISDYAGDTVINFDDDPNDNFGVLADGVVYGLCENMTETENGYVLTGADEALKNLQPEQVVYIADSSNNAIAIKAQSVSVSGDTVTIIEGEDIDISDIYQYLQIDMEFEENPSIDDVTEDGVICRYVDDSSSSIDLETNVFADAASEELQSDGLRIGSFENHGIAPTLELDYPTVYIKGDKDSADNIALDIKCELKLSFLVHAVYDARLFGDDFFEIGYVCTKSAEVSVTVAYHGSWDSTTEGKDGKKEQRLKLFDKDFPIGETGLKAGLEIYVPYSIEVEAGLQAKYSWDQSETYTYNTTSGEHVSKTKHAAVNLLQPEGSATLKVGLEADVTVALLGDIVKISLYAKATLSGKIELATDLGFNATNAESVHSCAVCLTLNVDVTIQAGVKVSVSLPCANGTIADLTLIEIKIPLFTGYCSVSHGFKFGKGECPYKEYRIYVTLKDADGNAIDGLDYSVSGGTSTSGTTGTFLYLAANQDYLIKLTYDGHTYVKTLNNLSKAHNIEFTVDTPTASGTLTGRICKASDKTTPVSGAKISVYSGNDLYTTLTSDSSGNYTTPLPVGQYNVVITADGYKEFSCNAEITENQTAYMETFLMIDESEDETGIAGGQVRSALTGSGIEGVSLSFRAGWNNSGTGDIVSTASTGENGSYSVELPLGNYTMFMEKDGYVTGSTNIIVQAGTTGYQNGTITPIISGDSYRIILTWGDNPRDMDSHIIGTLSGGGSFHVYFGNKNKYDGDVNVANLDVDDTSGRGPETITLNVTTDDPYYYYVYKYAGTGTTASSGSQVKVYQGSNLVATFNVPTDQGSGSYWNVFAIVNGELIVQNTVTSSADTGYATVAVDGTAYDYADEDDAPKEEPTVTEADDSEDRIAEAEDTPAAAPEVTAAVTDFTEEPAYEYVTDASVTEETAADVSAAEGSSEIETAVPASGEIGK